MTTSQDLRATGFSEEEWEAALEWTDYLASVEDRPEVWELHVRRTVLDEEARHRLRALPGARRVLVLTEDWCGDAARSVPVLARAFDEAPGVQHRYLPSDAWPGAIGRNLTHGGKAIPMAIVQDERGLCLGVWGPRPAPLQALLRARKRALGGPKEGERGAWYAPILGWYAKDRGRTTVEEILMLLERGGTQR